MPSSPKGPCTFPGCGNIRTRGRHCDDHQRSNDAPRRDGWVYEDRRYKVWRAAVKRRDPVCRGYPQPGCTNATTQADHVLPIVDGGAPFDPDNGQGLCDHHHRLKTREDRRRRRSQHGVGVG